MKGLELIPTESSLYSPIQVNPGDSIIVEWERSYISASTGEVLDKKIRRFAEVEIDKSFVLDSVDIYKFEEFGNLENGYLVGLGKRK